MVGEISFILATNFYSKEDTEKQ